MKNKFLLYFFTLITNLTISCQKECILEDSINGDWNWTKSIGGITGKAITPKIVGFSRRLVIRGNSYLEYINDTLVYRSKYKIETRPDTIYETNKYIVFESGTDFAIKADCEKLILYDIFWIDGVDQHFERE